MPGNDATRGSSCGAKRRTGNTRVHCRTGVPSPAARLHPCLFDGPNLGEKSALKRLIVPVERGNVRIAASERDVVQPAYNALTIGGDRSSHLPLMHEWRRNVLRPRPRLRPW